MESTSNGTAPARGATTATSDTTRAPRRIVVLEGDDQSAVARVLAEYEGTQISGRRLHLDLVRLAEENRGQTVAAEWYGPLGWTRFLWCRK